MIVPPNMLPATEQQSALEAAGVGLPHMLMAAAQMSQTGKLDQILASASQGTAGATTPDEMLRNQGSQRNQMDLKRDRNDLPSRAPAIRPGTYRHIAQRGSKHRG